MRYLSDNVERAIDELAKLPGIGRKSAQRLVFYFLRIPKDRVFALTNALIDLKEKVTYCSICYNITESDPCQICASRDRDKRVVCVVEEANDILAIEKTNQFKGTYHVLGGALSPLDGIGPEDLRIKQLLQRLNGNIQEVILATNPSAEGEATALYLTKLIKPTGIKITRIARGIPVGTDLEFADEITLAKALEGRTNL